MLTPWFLFRYIGQGEDREIKPLIGFGPSVVVAALLMIGFYRLHAQPAWRCWRRPRWRSRSVFRTNLAVASTVFVLGLYCVLTRRDAVKTVIGLCLLENGVHLSLVSLAPELPETALFGVATEVVVTVLPAALRDRRGAQGVRNHGHVRAAGAAALGAACRKAGTKR